LGGYIPVGFPSPLEKMLMAFFRMPRSDSASRSCFLKRAISAFAGVCLALPWPVKLPSGFYECSERQISSGRMPSPQASSFIMSLLLLSSTAISLNSLLNFLLSWDIALSYRFFA